MKKFILIFATLLSSAAFAGEKIEYKVGNTVMEGYLALPTTKRLNNPAVLIVHDWMGPSEFTEKKADEMAALGYVALAVDIYGKGVRPKDAKEAGALAGKYKKNLKLFRQHIQGGYDFLLKQPTIDKTKVVAFGYCFGGSAVLELARVGTDLAGVVSFHGGLPQMKVAEAAKIKTKMLVLHGGLDPHTPQKDVIGFINALNQTKADYQLIVYSGAVHAFAVPSAGNNPASGAAYDEKADRRSWQAFNQFLGEVAPL